MIAIQPHVLSDDHTRPSSWNADLFESATIPQMTFIPPATSMYAPANAIQPEL
jgi:hypothetical protein